MRMSGTQYSFSARIYKVGINPCVDVPVDIGKALGRRGYVPVRGTVNGSQIGATLIPTGNGGYRFYINTEMCRQASVKVEDEVHISLEVDREPRVPLVPAPLAKAIDNNPTAKNNLENKDERKIESI